MKRHSSIQLKATFLLVVFAMNTVVGLACGIGMTASLKASNLNTAAKAKTHTKVPDHSKAKKHGHDKHNAHVQNGKANNNQANCCYNQVLRIQQADKSLVKTAAVHTPYPVTNISTFYIVPLYTSHESKRIYSVRSYHPPIPDIRIAIQSFQI